MDFAKLIVFQGRSRLSEPAIAFTGGVATYGVLLSAVETATAKIAEVGLKQGDLVTIDVRSPIQHVALILALGLCGVTSASVQTSFSVEMSGLKPDAILIDQFAKQPAGLRLISVDDSWFAVDPQRPPDFVKLLALPGFPDEDALVRVVFSSGTTGVPKSTGFTHGNMEHRLAHASFTYGGGGVSGIRVLCLMGFSTFGGYLAMIGALAGGGLACFAQQPGEVLHVLRMFNVNLLILAVVQLQGVLAALGDGRPPPALQTVTVGGSRIPATLLKEAQARLCSNIVFGYGSTEAGSMAHAPASMLMQIDGAAGFAYPWVTLEAVNEEGRAVAPGETGIFRVKTSEQAYYVVEHADNALLFRDGWFYPGDVGTIQADGLITATGRSAELINRGGSIVSPDLVESVLTMHPSVTEAVAFGLPTKTGIDEIYAVVVAPDRFSEAELLHFCRERLADKAPGAIRRLDAIPRTDSGKPKRRQVREQIMAAQQGA
jgi:acyl-coenzyme A synthetase/AMP-(fatty) acid ligase